MASQLLKRTPPSPPPVFPVLFPMTSTAAFSNLESGDYIVTATAYPNADGTGTAQASAAVTVTVVGGDSTRVGLTMDSTIDRMAVTATATTVSVGESATLTATPVDAAGNVVLTDPSRLQYRTSAPGIATLTYVQQPFGAKIIVSAAGLSAGVSTITAVEGESGRTGTIDITVKPLPAAQPTKYAISYLGTHPNYPFTSGRVINNKGEVAGVLSKGSSGAGADHLFIWRLQIGGGGQFTDLGAMPGFTSLYVTGMNDSGEICGDASRTIPFNRFETHAWVYKNGTFVDLNVPNEDPFRLPDNSATGINNAGQVVGYRRTQAILEAFTWQNGQLTFLDRTKTGSANAISEAGLIAGMDGKGAAYLLDYSRGQYDSILSASGFGDCRPVSISDDGLVVGSLDPIGGGALVRACFWPRGQKQPTLLNPLPGANISSARSVNSTHTIVGNSTLPTAMVAVRWNDQQAEPQNLNTLVPALGNLTTWLSTASDINDAGQIVGEGGSGTYVLTPIQ